MRSRLTSSGIGFARGNNSFFYNNPFSGGVLFKLKFDQPVLMRNFATYPLPPEYNWQEDVEVEQLPREHEHVSGESKLPEGFTFSALNPMFLGIAGTEIAELYHYIGSHEYNHPIHRHFQQLIDFTPERRILHSLAAELVSGVCIMDEAHLVEVTQGLMPEVVVAYNDRQIVLAEEIEHSKEKARRFMNDYLYNYDSSNAFHNQVKYIEREMSKREEQSSGPFDQARLYKAIMMLVQSKVYKERVYPHVDEAVMRVVNKRLVVCDVKQIPDDVRGSDQLWALPVKPADQRKHHIVAGGTATGKSASIAQFAARYKKETGKSGMMVTATLNVDWKRALIGLEDVVLPGHQGVVCDSLVKQSWGPLSHMEASIMTKLAMDRIHDRLHREGQAPEVFHETTFPDEDTVNLFMSKGGKLFVYYTNYDPDKAVDGNILRFKNTGRFVPIEIVLGSQQLGAQMLHDLAKRSTGQNITIEVHDTQSMIHDSNASQLGIAHIDLSKSAFHVYNIPKAFSNLLKALDINPKATDRKDVFSGNGELTTQMLAERFVSMYGNLDLAFVGYPADKVATTNSDDDSEVVYAGYTVGKGLRIYDEKIFDRMVTNCAQSRDLFNVLRNLSPDLEERSTASYKF